MHLNLLLPLLPFLLSLLITSIHSQSAPAPAATLTLPSNCIQTFSGVYTTQNMLPCIYCKTGYVVTSATYTCNLPNQNWPFISLTQLEDLVGSSSSCIQIGNAQNPCSSIVAEGLSLSINIDFSQQTVILTNTSNQMSRALSVINIGEYYSSQSSNNVISCAAITTADFGLVGLFELTTNLQDTVSVNYYLSFPDCPLMIVLSSSTVAGSSGSTSNTQTDTILISPWSGTAKIVSRSSTPVTIDNQQAEESQISLFPNVQVFTIPYAYNLSNLFTVETNFQFLDSDLNACSATFFICNDQGTSFSLCSQISVLGSTVSMPIFTLTPILLLSYIYSQEPAAISTADNYYDNDDSRVLTSEDTQNFFLSYGSTSLTVPAALTAVSTKIWIHQLNTLLFTSTDATLTTIINNMNTIAWNSTLWTNTTGNNQFRLMEGWFNQIFALLESEQAALFPTTPPVQGAPPAIVPAQIELPDVIAEAIIRDFVEQSNNQYYSLCSQSFRSPIVNYNSNYNIDSSNANLACAVQLYSTSYGAFQENCVWQMPSLSFDLNLNSYLTWSNSSYYSLNWAPYGPIFTTVCTSIFDSQGAFYSTENFNVYVNSVTILTPNETIKSTLSENTQIFLPLFNFLTKSNSYTRLLLFDLVDNQCLLLPQPSILYYNSSLSILSQIISQTGTYFIVSSGCDSTCLSCSGPSSNQCLTCDINYIYWAAANRCLPLSFDPTSVVANCLTWNISSNLCNECNQGFNISFLQDQEQDNESQQQQQQCTLFSKSLGIEFCNNYTIFLSNAIVNSPFNLTNLVTKLISDLTSVQSQLNEEININGILQAVYDAYEIAQIKSISDSSENILTSISTLTVSVFSLASLGFIVEGDRVLLQRVESYSSSSPSSSQISLQPSSSSSNMSAPEEAQSLSYTSCGSSFCDPPFCDNSIGPWSRVNFLDANNNPLQPGWLQDGTLLLNLTVNENLTNYQSVAVSYWNSTSQTCTSNGLNFGTVYNQQSALQDSTSFVTFSSQVTGGYFVLTGESIYGNGSSAPSSSSDSLLWLLMLLLLIPLSTVPIYCCHKRYHKHIRKHQKERRKNKSKTKCGWFFSYCNPLFLLWILCKSCLQECCCCLSIFKMCCCLSLFKICCCCRWCFCCCCCCWWKHRRRKNRVESSEAQPQGQIIVITNVDTNLQGITSSSPQFIAAGTSVINNNHVSNSGDIVFQNQSEKPPLYRVQGNSIGSQIRVTPLSNVNISRQDTHEADREEESKHIDDSLMVTPNQKPTTTTIYNQIKRMNDSEEIEK